jgi:hypothetical protein
MDALAEQERADFQKWLTFRQHLHGDVCSPFDTNYHRRDIQIRITDVKKVQSSLQFSTQSFPLQIESVHVSFSVSSASTPEENCSATFGSWHVMEALAHEIERTIFKANGADAVVIESTVPPYPYKFGRLLFERFAKMSPAVGVFSRVCLMALQSTDPGLSFIDIANAFANRPAGEADEVTLSRMEDITLHKIREIANDIINRTLRPEFNIFASRGGPVGRAIAALGDLCCKYVDLRSNDLFFELRLFEQILDRDTLRHLIESFPPCPIVHEAKIGGGTEFFNLSLTELSQDAVDALCVYQTFGQFMFAHLRQDGFSKTSQGPRSRCIFFGACAAPQATHTPDLCQTRPWTAFRQNDANMCTYAAGVSASRGRADL